MTRALHTLHFVKTALLCRTRVQFAQHFSSHIAFSPSSQPDISSSLIDPTQGLLTGSWHMVMWGDWLEVNPLNHHNLGDLARSPARGVRWCHLYKPMYHTVRGKRLGEAPLLVNSLLWPREKCFLQQNTAPDQINNTVYDFSLSSLSLS